ncbi:MAG TPA: hypothetical protein VII47_11755 [Actinomycetota bacterium]
MTTPRRLLRAVTGPSVDDDRPQPAEDPTAADALLAPPAVPAVPAVPAAVQQILAGGADPDTTPGAPFLAMVERAAKVAPIHGTAELTPAALLQMIGGVAAPPTGAADGDSRRAAEAALERLAAAAWDVVRTGAADEPELQRCVVEVCTRLGGMDPRRSPTD